MAVFDFDPPQMGENPDATARYLYRLVEKLRWMFDHLDDFREVQVISESSANVSMQAIEQVLDDDGYVTEEELPTWGDIGLRYLIYENVNAIAVGDTQRRRVMRIHFQQDIDYHVSIDMEFLFTAAASGTSSSTTVVDPDTGDVTVTAEVPDTLVETEYFIDDVAIVGHNPKMTCVDGKHIMRVRWDSRSMPVGSHNFDVFFTCTGGGVNIPLYGINAWVCSAGLGTATWDGTIEVEDEYTPMTFAMAEITDSAPVITFQTPIAKTISDTYTPLTFAMVTLTDTSDLRLGIYVSPIQYVSGQTIPASTTIWQATANDQYVDSIDVYDITGFFSASGGMLSYMASFDSGVTWKGWDGNGNTWIENLTMTYETIHGITTGWPSGKVRVRAIFDNNEYCYGFFLEGAHL